MNKFFLFLVAFFTVSQVMAQPFRLKADKIYFTNDGSPAELIIENSTKNVKGVLVNTGKMPILQELKIRLLVIMPALLQMAIIISLLVITPVQPRKRVIEI